jgi:hypothetical protein
MKKEVIALTVVGLMIVSAVAGYLAGVYLGPSQTTTVSATPITLPVSVCTSPIPQFNGTGITGVYQIAPESIGVICIEYEFQGNGSYPFSPPDYGPQTDSSGSSWIACEFKGGSAVASACSGLSITPSQPSINHLTSPSVTVAYTVRTATSVPSVFWFFIGNCDAIPLAVGEQPSFVIRPGFGCVGSAGAPTNVVVVGTWNINVTETSTSRPLP